jgi:hypothetical protein
MTDSKIFLFIFLLFLLLVDFFIVSRLDPVCHTKQGYGFSYATGEPMEVFNQMRFGAKRINYNFSHFSLFWTKAPFGKNFSNLIEFLKLDGNPLWMNIGHFFAFFIFTLVLLYFFRLNLISVFLITFVFNIFHEYIAEGICVDPSFNDLWVDLIGSLVGILFFVIWPNLVKQKFFP